MRVAISCVMLYGMSKISIGHRLQFSVRVIKYVIPSVFFFIYRVYSVLYYCMCLLSLRRIKLYKHSNIASRAKYFSEQSVALQYC